MLFLFLALFLQSFTDSIPTASNRFLSSDKSSSIPYNYPNSLPNSNLQPHLSSEKAFSSQVSVELSQQPNNPFFKIAPRLESKQLSTISDVQIDGTQVNLHGISFQSFKSVSEFVAEVIFITPTEITPDSDIDILSYWPTSQDIIQSASLNGTSIEILNQDIEANRQLHIRAGIEEMQSGRYNLKLFSRFAQSESRWTALSHSSEGQNFSVEVLPVIYSIYPNLGSPEGGQIITIQGSGFNHNASAAYVEILGASCEVQSLINAQIICKTTKMLSGKYQYYEGNAGWKREIWLSASQNLTSQPDIVDVVATPDFYIPYSEYTVRLSGIFQPDKDALYRYYLASNGPSYLLLSKISSNQSPKKMISSSDSTSYRGYFNSARMSDYIPMSPDSKYYLQVISNSTSPGYLTFGLEIKDNINHTNPIPYISHLYIKPQHLVREVQKLIIRGADGGNLTLTANSYISSVIYPRNETEWRYWSCEDILKAIQSWEYGDIQCDMTQKREAVIYSFEFLSPENKDRYLITANLTQVISQSHAETSSYVETYPSRTLEGSFRIKNGHIETERIQIGTSLNKLQRTISKAFESLEEHLLVMGKSNFDELDIYIISEKPQQFEMDISLNDEIPIDKGVENRNDTVLGEFWWSVPSRFVSTYEQTPQITVRINNSRSVCKSNCTFSWVDSESLPRINDMIQDSTNITLLGGPFNQPKEVYTPMIGDSICPILNMTSTSIICSKPAKLPGSYIPYLYISPIGIVPTHSKFNKTVEYNFTVSSIYPISGSMHGGTLLTISGEFYPTHSVEKFNSSVTIGSSECEIVYTNSTVIQCITSEMSDTGELSIDINGREFRNDSYRYEYSTTPNITNLFPTTLAAFETNRLTITGDFITDKLEELGVYIGGYECEIEKLVGNEIQCKFLGAPSGKYQVRVKAEGIGYGVYNETLDVEFEVKGVRNNQGSLAGGTMVRIEGTGLYSQRENIRVYLGSEDLPCEVVNITIGDTLTCITSPHYSNETVPIHVFGRTNLEASYRSDFNFTYSYLYTPIIYNLSSSYGVQGDILTISGSFLSPSQDIILTIGTQIPILTSSDSSISLSLPDYPAGTYPISLQIPNLGYAMFQTSNLFTYSLNFISLSPNHTSSNGGEISLIMYGLSSNCSVWLDDVECSIRYKDQITYKILCNPFYTSDSALLLNVQCQDSVFECDDVYKCGVTFDKENVPVIESIEGELVIRGKGFGNSEDIEVYIGDTQCEIDSVSDEEIKCTPKAKAGYSEVKVLVPSKGWAKGDLWYFQEFSVDDIDKIVGSFGGGREIKLSGKGFSKGVKVNICGSPCKIEYVDYGSLRCKSPKIVNPSAQEKYYRLSYHSEILGISISSSSSPIFLTDSDSNTSYFSSSCNIDLYNQGYTLSLSKLSILSSGSHYNDYTLLSNLRILASTDQITWEEVGRINNAEPGWNNITFSGKDQYKLYKIYKPESCKISELKLYGKMIYENNLPYFDCDIDIEMPDMLYQSNSTQKNTTQVILKNRYRVDEAMLPVVTDIQPRRIPTTGQEIVNFTGYNFGENTMMSDVSIFIDSVYCSVVFVNDSLIQCIAGAKQELTEHSLEIAIKQIGNVAVVGSDVMYVSMWSDEASWGMKTGPLDGEDLFINKGQYILLDLPTNKLAKCIIEGALIVKDTEGIVLECDYIVIRNGGMIIIGDRNEEYENYVEIRVRKGIEVEEGGINMYGKSVGGFKKEGVVGNKGISIKNGDSNMGEIEVMNSKTGIIERARVIAVNDTNLILEQDLSKFQPNNDVEIYYLSRNIKIISQSSISLISHSLSNTISLSNIEFFSPSLSDSYFLSLSQSNIHLSSLSIHSPFPSSIKSLLFQDTLQYTHQGHSSLQITSLLPDTIHLSLGSLKLGVYSKYSYASILIEDRNSLNIFNPSVCIDTDGYWLDLEDTKHIKFSMLNNCPQISQFSFSSFNSSYSDDQNLAMFDIPIFDFENSKEMVRLILDINSLDSYINITNSYSSRAHDIEYLHSNNTIHDTLKLQIGKQVVDSRDSVSFKILEEPIVYQTSRRNLQDTISTYIRPSYDMQSYTHSPGSFIIFAVQPHNTTSPEVKAHDLQLNFSLPNADFSVNYAQEKVILVEIEDSRRDRDRLEWWVWLTVVGGLFFLAILALILVVCQSMRRKAMFEELRSPASPEIVIRGFGPVNDDRFMIPHISKYRISVNFTDEVPFVRSPSKHHTDNTEIMRSRSIIFTEEQEQSPIIEEPSSPQSASITECQTSIRTAGTPRASRRANRPKSMAQLKNHY